MYIDKNILQITVSGGNPDNSQALLALYDQSFRACYMNPPFKEEKTWCVCVCRSHFARASFVCLFTDVYSALYVGGSICSVVSPTLFPAESVQLPKNRLTIHLTNM